MAVQKYEGPSKEHFAHRRFFFFSHLKSCMPLTKPVVTANLLSVAFALYLLTCVMCIIENVDIRY